MNKSSSVLERYYREGRNENLKEELIKEYVPLVKLVCGRLSNYTSGVLEMEDLYSYGIFGLIDAIDKFDIDKNVKFETYASFRIKGTVIDAIRNTDYVPRVTRQKEKELQKAKERLCSEGIYSEEKLAEELGMSIDALRKFEGDMERWNFVWIDNDTSGDECKIPSNLPGPESVVDEIGMNVLKEKLAKAMGILTENERKAITLIFYEEMTQKEVAEVMGLSTGRISQLMGHALVKLKKELGEYSYLFSA